MNSKLQVFISSTFLDLKTERQAAVEAILRSGHFPAGMELFTAGDQSQWEIIQRWITESDLYVLILGGRYGSIEPDSGLSYTELEYDFAVSLGIPYFAIVITDEGIEAKVKEFGTSVIEKNNQDKLDQFREKVLSKISTFYTDSKDVKLAVLESIPKLQSEYQLNGWVRSEEIPDTKALAEEIASLHKENSNLKDKLSKLENKQDRTTGNSQEFEEIYKILFDKKLDISSMKATVDNKDDIPDEMDVMSLSRTFLSRLMTGVTNEYGMGNVDKFIFFRLCPILQVYDLVVNEKVPSVRYRRYAITKKGTKFFAYIDKKLHKANNKETKKKKTVKKSTRKDA